MTSVQYKSNGLKTLKSQNAQLHTREFTCRDFFKIHWDVTVQDGEKVTRTDPMLN